MTEQYKGDTETRTLRARIPGRYAAATFESYEKTPDNASALLQVKRWTEEFVPNLNAPGLLLHGTVGTGKTHLAIAALRELIRSKGLTGRFADTRELLDRLRCSYDEGAQESQAQILKPLIESDLVVLDDLGASRATDWVHEMVELVISQAYNKFVTLIVTTNLVNKPLSKKTASFSMEEGLAERIGMRMWSRLQQMCVPVQLVGPDFRLAHRDIA